MIVQSLWIYSSHSLSWAQGEVRRREIHLHIRAQNVSIQDVKVKKSFVQDLSNNTAALVGILKSCAKQQDLHSGFRMHAVILQTGLLSTNVYVGTSLVNMYAKCGMLAEAQKVFEELSIRNVISWSALITAYVQNGCGTEALSSFDQMVQEGLVPNAVTFICTLKACGMVGACERGKDIHAEIIRQGLLDNSVMLGTALVDMYAKCGMLDKSQDILNALSVRNVVCWNALIAAYLQWGLGGEALKCFEQMQYEGYPPDEVSVTCALKACSDTGEANKGKEIHCNICSQGLLVNSIMVGTALLDMYGKCGLVANAQEVFHELPIRNIVPWNALIAGYAQHGYGEEALDCFLILKQEGLSPDTATYNCILKACGTISAVEMGEKIHTEIVKEQLLEKSLMLGNTLIDMYAKCGALVKAQKVFNELLIRNVVSWSALIAGYSQHGNGDKVVNALGCMQQQGLLPDSVLYIILLNACSHSGLVDEGQLFFPSISRDLGIIPTCEHDACLVDLFGRAGHLDKVMRVINKVALTDCHQLWYALLGACQKWGNVKLGRLTFELLVEVDEKDSGVYTCMGDMYTAG